MSQRLNLWCVGMLIAGLLLVLAACGPTSQQGAPNLNATVQAALAQTRAVEVAVATFVAATSQAQQTAVAQTGQAASPSPTLDAPTPVPPTTTSAPTTTPIPTSLPTSLPTPTPTPTPTEERIVIAETAVDGSDGDGREILISRSPTNGGRVIFLPNFDQSQVTSPMVFGNYVTARIAIFDTRRSGRKDGNGIRRVVFQVVSPTGGTYNRTEEAAPYCLFGGNDPACPGIDVRRARDDWPDGQYSATIKIEALDGLTSNWNWTFCVKTCDFSAPPIVEFVEIGRNSLDPVVDGELVFQVRAYQESAGSGDGDGIDYVDFYIYDSGGNQVWYKREENAAFCAFGGSSPCPATAVDTPGQYRLVAVAAGSDGQQTRIEQVIEVQ